MVDISNLVEIHELSFYRGKRIIFDNISMKFPRSKIIGVMGPSGIGKTTLLHLIGGQLYPDKGEIYIDGDNISKLSRCRLYEIRKKISLMFQSGALFTNINVFENVAFPLRQHTSLPEPILRSTVLMKLEAVGLREAATLMPNELSTGMLRRVALARSIALDPELIMFDEPFVGQDPIGMGMLLKLISELNSTLGITCIIVSHDVPEVLSIADYTYIIAEHQVIAEGTPVNIVNNQDPRVRQFIKGVSDGPIPFHFPAEDYQIHLFRCKKLNLVHGMLRTIIEFIAFLGRYGINICYRLGQATVMLFNTLVAKPAIRGQWPLFSEQFYRIGVLSLIIVVVSSLFVSMVFGLQGYRILTTYGAESSLGTLISLSLLRELGPVLAALLFAGRAGSSLTAEIGLMKTTEQLSSLEMMAVDPLRKVVAPRFWAGIISLPLLTLIFVVVGIWGGSIVGIKWKGIDSGLFWSAIQNALDWKKDLINCVIKSIVFSITVTWIALFNGYNAIPTSEGISQATTRSVVHSSLMVLVLDFILTTLMFLD